MRIREDHTFAGASWAPYMSQSSFTLSLVSGVKRVYVQYLDAADNPSAIVWAKITLTSGTVSPGPTYISGVLEGQIAWTLAGAPYIVIADALVDGQSSLTIESGVEVRFATGTTLYVDGALRAEGTEDNEVVFTSDKASPAAGDWQGIQIRDSSDDSRTLLSHVRVQYAQGGINISSASPTVSYSTIVSNTTGIGCSWWGSGPLITNNLIAYNSTGIDCRPSEARVISNTVRNNGTGVKSFGTIRNNTITQNTYGVDLSSGGGASITEISGNTIAANARAGLRIFGYPVWSSQPISGNSITNNGVSGTSAEYSGIYLKDFQGTFSNNTITGNGNGIWNDTGSYGANLTITNNDIYGNNGYDLKHLRGETLPATNNYWGTTDAEVIATKIYDYYDNFNYGKVNYSTFAP